MRKRTERKMRIRVNNEPVEFKGRTVAELIEQLNLPQTGVAVAVGMDIVPKSDWETTEIKQDEELMIIRAASGGMI